MTRPRLADVEQAARTPDLVPKAEVRSAIDSVADEMVEAAKPLIAAGYAVTLPVRRFRS